MRKIKSIFSFSLLAQLRGGTGGGITVPNQTARFGALTPSGNIGWKPMNSVNTEVDLTGSPVLVGGSLGAFTAAITGGRLTFTGATGAPNGAVLRCTLASGGSVDATISAEAGARTVGSTAEMLVCANLSSAQKSGLRIIVRAATYTPWNGSAHQWAAKLESLSDWLIFEAEKHTIKPVWNRFFVGNGSASGNTQGYVAFEYIDFFETCSTEIKLTSPFTSSSRFLLGGNNNNPTSNIRITGCSFDCAAPNARTTGLRPTEHYGAIGLQDASNVTIEDCHLDNIVYGITVGRSNTIIRRNLITNFWDDPIKVVPRTGVNMSGLVIQHNRAFDCIGDHGYHPDMIVHIFPNIDNDPGTSVVAPLIEGNMCFPGAEGVIQAAYPISVDGGAYAHETSLTTANRTITESDDEKFIFVDASSAPITITLSNPASAAGNYDVLVQAFLTPTAGLTIASGGFVLFDTDEGANITSLATVIPWATIQLRCDKTLNRWTLHRHGPTYQSLFTKRFGDGINDLDARFNLAWGNSNAVRQESAVSGTGWDVRANSFIPVWPNLPGGKFTYSPEDGNRFIQFDNTGGGHSVVGNIAGTITGAAVGTGANNILAAELDLNNSFAAFAGAFQVANPAIPQVNPTSIAEAIAYARPKAGSVMDGTGLGAGLAVSPANDFWNFGQHVGEQLGARQTVPWYVLRPTSTLIGGGVRVEWQEPAFLPSGLAITQYEVLYSKNGGAYVSLYTGLVRDQTYTGAVIGDTIDVRIIASNANGAGTVSQLPQRTVTQNVPAAIAPVALVATYLNGTQNASKTITTTIAASGNSPVLVTLGMRFTGAQVLQNITATLNGVAMQRLQSENGVSTAFQIVRFWSPSADVPSGTFNIVVSNGTANFNGISARVLEMVNAKDDQTGAAVGAMSASASALTRTPSVTATSSGSWVDYVSVSAAALTGIAGATSDVPGTTNAGNAVTWVGHASEVAALPGAFDATFTQTPSGNFAASALEVLAT